MMLVGFLVLPGIGYAIYRTVTRIRSAMAILLSGNFVSHTLVENSLRKSSNSDGRTFAG